METPTDTPQAHGTGAGRHPLQACAEDIAAALKDTAGVDPLFAPVDVKREVLVSLSRLGDQLEALRMDVIANASDVAEADAARSVATWLTPLVLTETGTQAAAAHLANDLHTHYPLLREALAGARANLQQTKVITRSLNELRRLEDVTPEILVKAEEFLVAECARLTPSQLKVLADGVLEHLDPEVFTEAERKKLENDLKKARADSRLVFRKRGDGSTDIHARIPDAHAQRLKTALDAFTSPRHDPHSDEVSAGGTDGASGTDGAGAGGSGAGSLADGAVVTSRYRDPATGERLTQDRLLGEAFCAFLERHDPNTLPKHGGMATTLVITVDYNALTAQLGNGTLPDGSKIPAGDVRRLACNARILPAVLDGPSALLDLGTTHRLFSVEQRIALALAHPTCQASGCTIPSTWCEAHHRTPWSHGGKTDLADGMLLCAFHHQRIHDDSYLVKHLPNGDVRFARRT